MPTRAEALFEILRTRDDVNALIGRAEDADFDCKVWASNASAMTGSIAKAACGFANATGGVIVIGVLASGRGADTPDVVRELRPVDDVGAVASAALDIILKQVQPGIVGVQTRNIPDRPTGAGGYVVVFVPEAEDSPRRSVVTKEFYVRVASGTLPMEMFQIADRFGRRPHPRLVIDLSDDGITPEPTRQDFVVRLFKLTIQNQGRGMAKFPAVRFKTGSSIEYPYSPYQSETFWPVSRNQPGWCAFRGGANDVLYPGETALIARLKQGGTRVSSIPPADQWKVGTLFDWDFRATTLELEVMCEGMAPHSQSFAVAAHEHRPKT